jgi:hypothetical protein
MCFQLLKPVLASPCQRPIGETSNFRGACPTAPKRVRRCSGRAGARAPSGLAVCSRSAGVVAAHRSSSASASVSACGSLSERKRKCRLLQARTEPAPRPRRPRRSNLHSTMRYQCHAPRRRAWTARSRRRCVRPCPPAGRASCSSPSATPPSARCCVTLRSTAGVPASRTSWARWTSKPSSCSRRAKVRAS